MSTSGEFPVASFDDNEYPRAFEEGPKATIEAMYPTEIVYMPVNPPDHTNSPLVRNQYNQLLLSRYVEIERPDYTDLHNANDGPVPDWSEPFVGIMRIYTLRADGAVIDGYIVDIRTVVADDITQVDFSDIPEDTAELITRSSIKVFGIILPDIDGEMNYLSPDNAATEDAAKYLWEYTNGTWPQIEVTVEPEPEPVEPEPTRKHKKKKRDPNPADGGEPQTVPEGDPEA